MSAKTLEFFFNNTLPVHSVSRVLNVIVVIRDDVVSNEILIVDHNHPDRVS